MSPQAWTREQDLAVLYLKVEYHGELAPGHTAVLALAGAMDRTVASIWMRKGNFDALDTAVPGGGLNSAAKLTVDIWAEYQQYPEQVLSEARRAYLNLVSPRVISPHPAVRLGTPLAFRRGWMEVAVDGTWIGDAVGSIQPRSGWLRVSQASRSAWARVLGFPTRVSAPGWVPPTHVSAPAWPAGPMSWPVML